MFGTEPTCYVPRQLYHVGQDGLTCQVLPPALRVDIFYYWVLRIEQRAVSLPVIPDGAIDLVVSPEIAGFAALYTPRPERFEIALQGPIVYAGVCFPAGRLAARLGRSVNDLDAIEPGIGTTTELGLQALVDAIHGLSRDELVQQTMDAFFADYPWSVSGPAGSASLLEVFEHRDEPSVSTVARHLGLSERQLRRVTRDLFSNRLGELKGFYSSRFGFEPVFFDESFYLQLLHPGSGAQLGFLTPAHETQPAFLHPQAVRDGMVISFEVADAEAAWTSATDAGLPIAMELKHEQWGQAHFMVRDPAGFVVDIVEHVSAT